MSLQVTIKRSLISKKSISVFFAMLALLVQPIVSLNIPAAFAATITDRVVINEVMPNPAMGEKEWVELYNPTSAAVSLSGWVVTYNNGTVSYPISPSEITAGGFVVVEAPDSTSYLNNAGDTIGLRNNSSEEINSVTYTNDTPEKSYARVNDASTDFNNQAEPTKGNSNFVAPVKLNHVCASGCQYTTIQSAVDDADVNTTITVEAGIYNESVLINKSITLEGAQAGIDARNRNASESTLSLVGTSPNFTVRANNVTIDGFTLNSAAGDSAAINLMGGFSGTTIKNNIINNSSRAVVSNSSNTTFTQNRVNNNATATSGVEQNTNAANNVVVANNDFNAGQNNADINFIGLGGSQSTGLVVSGNKSNGSATFLGLTNTSGAVISGNTITSSRDSSIFIGGNNANVTINGNRIANTSATSAAVVVINPFGYGRNSEIQGRNNNFEGTVNAVVAYPEGVALNQRADFAQNWWGNVAGPTDPDATDGSQPASNGTNKGAGAYGVVKYGPWCVTAACDVVSGESLAAPTDLTPPTGAFTKNPDFAMTWKAVANSLSYEYRTSNTLNQDGSLGSIIYSDSSVTQPSRYSEANGIVTRLNSATPAGTYYWQVRAIGQGGVATSPWSAISKVTVDYTKPQLYLKDTSLGSISTRVLREADLKLTDNAAVAAYYINGVRVAVSQDKFSDANDIRVGNNNGKYGVNTIQVEDAAGNLSEIFSFTLDNIAPTATPKASSLGSDGYYREVSYQLADAYKIDKVTLNGTEKDLNDNAYSDLNNIKPGVFGAKEGENTLVVYDVAGNAKTYVFTIDTVKPTGTFSYNPSNNDVKKGPVTVMLTTSEPVTTPTDWTKVTDKTFTRTFTDNVKGSVVVIDRADNVSSTLSYEVKRIDNTSPTIGGVTDGELRNTTPASFTVTDQNFKQATVNGQNANCTYTGANFVWNCNGMFVEGTNTIIALDKADNQSKVVFTIDTKLDVSISTSNNGAPTREPVTVTITSDEAISVEGWSDVSADGKVWTKEFSENTTEPVDVSVKDVAGNVKTLQYTISGIDTTKPTVVVQSISRNSDGSYLVSGTVSEEGSTVFVSLDGGAAQQAAVTGLTWSYTTPILNDGFYSLAISSSDAVGNSGSVVTRTFSAVTPFVSGAAITTPLALVTPANTVFANNQLLANNGTSAATEDTAATEQGQVLGTRDNKSTNKVAAISPSEQGWKIFGFAWYWWLLILAAIAAIWWAIAGYRRRNNEEA